MLTESQKHNRALKANRKMALARRRADNRAQDHRDFIAARARRAPAGSIGASLR
jgi:hypothetical protein